MSSFVFVFVLFSRSSRCSVNLFWAQGAIHQRMAEMDGLSLGSRRSVDLSGLHSIGFRRGLSRSRTPPNPFPGGPKGGGRGEGRPWPESGSPGEISRMEFFRVLRSNSTDYVLLRKRGRVGGNSDYITDDHHSKVLCTIPYLSSILRSSIISHYALQPRWADGPQSLFLNPILHLRSNSSHLHPIRKHRR